MAVCTGMLLLACTDAAETSDATAAGRSKGTTPSDRSMTRVIAPEVDYTPVPLERLVGTAERIVIGTVETVDAESLGVRIAETLQGEPADRIVVERVDPPGIFAPRAVPYERGQEFVLFLAESAGPMNKPAWVILGYPIAGELPVEAGFVYFDSYDIDEFAFESFAVHGVTRPMQRFAVDEFRDAVATYRDCFAWRQVETTRNQRVIRRWEPSTVCNDAALDGYRARSPLHDYLAGVTLRQVPEGGRH